MFFNSIVISTMTVYRSGWHYDLALIDCVKVAMSSDIFSFSLLIFADIDQE